MDEKISIAPMMEWTDSHWRAMIRGVTRKTVLYTEMVVDQTIVHNTEFDNLQAFIGKNIFENPSVIQLGGNDPESLGAASDILSTYGDYSELNLNCGCPSPRVKKYCFGASLMLDPELVREITHTMSRKSNLPVTVKCRIGVDDRESYPDLCKFIQTVSLSGVNKFIIHARKCILNGLSPKQNRDIPPLKYEIVHRLVKDFPDFKFILNGGILEFDQANEHMIYEECGSHNWAESTVDLPPVSGCMIGRAAYNNPLLFANADSYFHGVDDPCLTRREIIERYLDYCDWVQSEEGPRCIVKSKRHTPRTTFLFKPLHNIFNGYPRCHKFRTSLNDVTLELRKRSTEPTPRDVVEISLETMPDEILDTPLGKIVESEYLSPEVLVSTYEDSQFESKRYHREFQREYNLLR